MHQPTSFCLKWEIWNPVRLFLLDIPWFAFLKTFQTAQVSWMSRWVPERRTTEKNSDTGYIAMFLLGQRHSFIKITAPKCFQRRFRWNLDTTNQCGAYDWVGVVSNCLMGVFWVESSVPVSCAKSYQTIKTRERRQRPQSGPIVLFDTTTWFRTY